MAATNTSVVVITGASSGIGQAAALEFARKGASVVLAARRKKVLMDVAEQCREAGGDTLVVPTDVRDPDAVAKLVQKTIETFGRIDTWVNNAAVSLFGRFEETPPSVYREVIETNLFGYIHGARAVLPVFREQGEGVLINVSSVVAGAPQPYTSAYVASKHAIRGLTDCLRMELALDEAPNIHICSLLPASIDTNIFQNAANYTGRAVKPLDPVYEPEKVGRAIVDIARHPTREKIVGEAGRFFMLQHMLLPTMYEKIASHKIDSNHLQTEPVTPNDGNLYDPSEYTGMSGGWRHSPDRPWVKRAAVGAAIGIGAGLLAAGTALLLSKGGRSNEQSGV